jgi:hypothetical protein
MNMITMPVICVNQIKKVLFDCSGFNVVSHGGTLRCSPSCVTKNAPSSSSALVVVAFDSKSYPDFCLVLLDFLFFYSYRRTTQLGPFQILHSFCRFIDRILNCVIHTVGRRPYNINIFVNHTKIYRHCSTYESSARFIQKAI